LSAFVRFLATKSFAHFFPLIFFEQLWLQVALTQLTKADGSLSCSKHTKGKKCAMDFVTKKRTHDLSRDPRHITLSSSRGLKIRDDFQI
jgi:hypothetical protein